MTEEQQHTDPILEHLTDHEGLDPEVLSIDPLKPYYRRQIARKAERIESLLREKTALLCIDMQYLDAARGYGVFADDSPVNTDPESQEYYFTALEKVVLPNMRRLQDGFRHAELEVIHVRICSLTRDGRDRGSGHKKLHLLAPPGSKEAEFLPEVAPQGDEIVINKTASGVFTSTNLEYVLRNLEVDSLFVTGVLTDECVSTTVRDACDRGFAVTLVEDCCASVTPERHRFTIATLRDRYTRVLTTEEALAELDTYAAAGLDEFAQEG
ncbi:MAG: isochorismatase family cysteine hydrolase [Candidatus Competibacterales bacterium]|nr:isochorismatase family cysteine hydrolase [Candidatus Competibacterales bacterium]